MPLSPAALEPLLRLALVPGVGPQRLALLIRRFGSAERALAAPERELRHRPGIHDAVARGIREHAGSAGDGPLRAGLARLRRVEAVALTPDDLAYPDAFRVLAEPPYLLFAAGRLDLLGTASVAVVGTRAPTAYGLASTAGLVAGLSGAGYTIVSGMARGIDAAAHAAALGAGGGTVGVLGHGIDQVYPPDNRALFARVREQGLLISEFVPGERPKAGNFPRRNRLVTALSRGVVVVEMGLRSGAQHSVTFALEQGREVMAVPGPIGSPSSLGTNQLIRDGARVVTCVQDVLDEVEGVGASSPARPPLRPPPREQAALPLLSASEDQALRALSEEPRHVDDLCLASGLGPPALLGVLLDLELKGLAESLPGKRYRRVDERSHR